MADRYWVGGTGSWDASYTPSQHWATTSGGTAGASAPSSTDNAFFDSHSNEPSDATYTVTTGFAPTCNDLNVEGTGANKVIFDTGAADITVGGNVYLTGGTAGITWLFNRGLLMTHPAAGVVEIDLNGIVLLGGMNMTGGVSTVFTFLSDVNYGNAGTRSFILTSGSTDFTTYSASFLAVGATLGIAGSLTFYRLSHIPTTPAKYCYLYYDGNITVTDRLSISAGATVTNRILVRNLYNGSGYSIDITGTSSNVFENVDFYGVNMITGGADLDLSAISGLSGDLGGNDGIIFTTAVPQYFYKASGSDNYSTAGNWYLGTGGSGGAGRVPLAQDNVIFNANSFGAASMTLTFDMRCPGKNITWTGATNTPTWTGTSLQMFSGSVTLISGMNLTGTAPWYFLGDTSNTLTSAGKITGVNRSIYFESVGAGETILAGAINSGSSGIILLSGGLNTNGQSVTTTGSFNLTGTKTRALTLGASAIAAGVWNATDITNLTFDCGTSVITLANGATVGIIGGGLTYYGVVLTKSNSNVGLSAITGNNTFTNLTLNEQASTANGAWTFPAGGTNTITGTFTFNGNSVANRVMIRSSVFGTQATISAAAISASNCDLLDINGTGAATWDLSGTSSGNCGNNTLKALGDAAFTSATTQHWVTTTGAWNTAASWTSRVPLAQDTVLMDKAFGTNAVVTVAGNKMFGKDIDWSGATFTTALTLAFSATADWYTLGALNMTLKTGMTVTGTSIINSFYGRGDATITTSGVTWPNSIFLYSASGTVKLGGNLTLEATKWIGVSATTTLTFINGASNYVFDGGYISNVAGNLSLGSGTHIMRTTGSFRFQMLAGGVLDAGTSTIKIVGSGTGYIYPLGATFYNIWFDCGASTSAISFSGSAGGATINELKDTGTAAHALNFGGGATYNIGTFTVSGTSSVTRVTIGTYGSGTSSIAPHYLVKTGGGTVNCTYMNISRSIASPANTWFATESINNQYVVTAGSGWIITPSVAVGVASTTGLSTITS